MKRIIPLTFFLLALLFAGCKKEDNMDPASDFPIPESYDFNRNGRSTVDLTEPGIQISMCHELLDALYLTGPFAVTLEEIMDIWNNENAPFEDPVKGLDAAVLNAYEGSIKDMVAASSDLFNGGNARSETIRSEIEEWMVIWMNDVIPYWNQEAERGEPGQIPDITQILDTRYVDSYGMEYLQVVSKTLDGALMMDQICNHWLSNDLILSSEYQRANDNEELVEGQNYTYLEYAWDQAYGYIYALSEDPANPMATMGKDDYFLNKYVKLINNDPDFSTIAQDIFDAYLTGRAAIVAGKYDEMKRQADIIKRGVSDVMIIRTVFYLLSGINEYEKGDIGLGGYLHDTGEGWGFVYALEFAKNPNNNLQYFTADESIEFRKRMLANGEYGLWDTEMKTLEDIAEEIATKMSWSAEEAKNF